MFLVLSCLFLSVALSQSVESPHKTQCLDSCLAEAVGEIVARNSRASALARFGDRITSHCLPACIARETRFAAHQNTIRWNQPSKFASNECLSVCNEFRAQKTVGFRNQDKIQKFHDSCHSPCQEYHFARRQRRELHRSIMAPVAEERAIKMAAWEAALRTAPADEQTAIRRQMEAYERSWKSDTEQALVKACAYETEMKMHYDHLKTNDEALRDQRAQTKYNSEECIEDGWKMVVRDDERVNFDYDQYLKLKYWHLADGRSGDNQLKKVHRAMDQHYKQNLDIMVKEKKANRGWRDNIRTELAGFQN